MKLAFLTRPTTEHRQCVNPKFEIQSSHPLFLTSFSAIELASLSVAPILRFLASPFSRFYNSTNRPLAQSTNRPSLPPARCQLPPALRPFDFATN
jgi:hypothetical protein